MNITNANSLISHNNSIRDSVIDAENESHEFNVAMSVGHSAQKLLELEENNRTSALITNNSTISTIINNQLQFYRKDYDRIQNLVPNTYRG